MSTLINNKIALKCDKCQHPWNTKSVLKYVTCPSCQRKVNVKKCQLRKCLILDSELIFNSFDAVLSNPPFRRPQKPKEKRWNPRGFRPGRWEDLN